MNSHPTLKQWSSSRSNVYLVEYSRFGTHKMYSSLFDNEESAYDFAYDLIEDRDLAALDVLHVPILQSRALHSMVRAKAELCRLEPRE